MVTILKATTASLYLEAQHLPDQAMIKPHQNGAPISTHHMMKGERRALPVGKVIRIAPGEQLLSKSGCIPRPLTPG